MHKKLLIKAGTLLDESWVKRLDRKKINCVKVRSAITCESRYGICAKCYGRDLAHGQLVNIGEAVGVVAAQSIGQTSIQLMEQNIDDTQTLANFFEVRSPKEPAIFAERTGTVSFGKETKKRQRLIITDEEGESDEKLILKGQILNVLEGDYVEKGHQIVDGMPNPHDVLRLFGINVLANYIVNEVQILYCLQNIKINDKHIEVIVRQMLRKVTVTKGGDTQRLPGELVDKVKLLEENEQAIAAGKEPATWEHRLLGITKASLAADSFLSAASFQETTRMLTEAAIKGKYDELRGPKENVILGRLIPVGTGFKNK